MIRSQVTLLTKVMMSFASLWGQGLAVALLLLSSTAAAVASLRLDPYTEHDPQKVRLCVSAGTICLFRT